MAKYSLAEEEDESLIFNPASRDQPFPAVRGATIDRYVSSIAYARGTPLGRLLIVCSIKACRVVDLSQQYGKRLHRHVHVHVPDLHLARGALATSHCAIQVSQDLWLG